MNLMARYSSLFIFVAGLVIGAPAITGCLSSQQRHAGDETSTAEGTVAPAPESARKAPPAQLSPAEMEELLRRKYEMRERMAKELNNKPPGPPGLPDEPVPETTVSKPPSSK